MSAIDKAMPVIKKYEGCELKSYLCPAKIATIGWGNTMYKNGAKVQLGQTITQKEADDLLAFHLNYFYERIKDMVKSNLNDNQLGALLSFSYNLGLGNLKVSTLLKKVNADPNDPTIKDEFLKWNKAGGKVLAGLTKRRQEESNLYFS